MSDNLRALNARMGPVARIAGILAVLGVIVFVFTLRSLGAAFMTPSAKEAKAQVNDQIKKLAADYASGLDGHTKQFNGRSVFFIPSPPVPPPLPPPPVDTSTPPPPPPPPPPSKYGGPKLIAMVNGVAWFDDGKKLAAGDEVKDKLKVKEIIAPWGALVDWDGVEFKISLFDKDSIVYPPPKKEEPTAAVKEETKDTASKDPAKETPPPVIKAGDKPPEAEATKPESPKPEAPEVPKPEQPEAPPSDQPKPDQPKPDKPDSPGSPESQTEKNE